MTTTSPDWLSKRDAADMLGISVRTIDRRIAEGELAAYRGRGSDRLVRIRRADLLASLELIPNGAPTAA